MSDPMLRIENKGPEIVSTNYFDHPVGEFLVSTNAGAFRLLLAPGREGYLAEMRTAKGAAISRGPWPAVRKRDAMEILFDDGSDSPFALQTAVEAFDRVPPDSESGRCVVLSVWVRGEDDRPRKALELPCVYRRAASIPDLRPWEES